MEAPRTVSCFRYALRPQAKQEFRAALPWTDPTASKLTMIANAHTPARRQVYIQAAAAAAAPAAAMPPRIGAIRRWTEQGRPYLAGGGVDLHGLRLLHAGGLGHGLLGGVLQQPGVLQQLLCTRPQRRLLLQRL